MGAKLWVLVSAVVTLLVSGGVLWNLLIRVERVAQSLLGYRGEIQQTLAEQGSRLETLNENLGILGTRFNATEGRVDQIEAGLSSQDLPGQLTQVVAEVRVHDETLARLQKHLAVLDQRVTPLEDWATTALARIDGLCERLDGFGPWVTTVLQQVEALDNRVTAALHQVEGIDNRVSVNAERVEEWIRTTEGQSPGGGHRPEAPPQSDDSRFGWVETWGV
jgi:uncharacterized coiled-coil protein SlyX